MRRKYILLFVVASLILAGIIVFTVLKREKHEVEINGYKIITSQKLFVEKETNELGELFTLQPEQAEGYITLWVPSKKETSWVEEGEIKGTSELYVEQLKVAIPIKVKASGKDMKLYELQEYDDCQNTTSIEVKYPGGITTSVPSRTCSNGNYFPINTDLLGYIDVQVNAYIPNEEEKNGIKYSGFDEIINAVFSAKKPN